MSRSLRLLVVVGAAATATACAHAPPGGDEVALAPLGEDLIPPPAAKGRRSHVITADTPIAVICAHPAGRAVLDRDLPGLTSRPEYVFFKGMSLKALQPMSHGKLTDADIQRVDEDLRALAPPAKKHRRRWFWMRRA